MFDYFNLEKSQKLVGYLWNLLNKNGKIIVTNTHPDNPTKFWMESGGWFLEYKNQEEMMLIADVIKKDFSIKTHLEKDPLGVYQYLSITKN